MTYIHKSYFFGFFVMFPDYFIKQHQQILYTIMMNKNSLANIMYQRSIERQSSKNISKKAHHLLYNQRDPQDKDNNSEMGNTLLKVTHFNTSSMINEVLQVNKKQRCEYSSSPQKVFNLKKMNEAKRANIYEMKRQNDPSLKKQSNKIVIFNKSIRKQYSKGKEGLKLLVCNQLSNKYDNPFNHGYKLENQTVAIFKPAELLDHQTAAYEKEQKFEQGIIGKPKQIVISNQISKISSARNKNRQKIVQLIQSTNNSQIKVKQKYQRKHSASSPSKTYSKHLQQQKKYQQNIQKQKRQILQLKRQLNKNYNKPFNPPENITAFSYIIYEADLKKSRLSKNCFAKRQQIEELIEVKKIFLHSHQVIAASNSRTVVQMASLTKIMTCITILQIGKKLRLRLSQQFVKIGLFEQNIGGTSANIKRGQIYSVQQLLYGLMLPSGNDASIALAVWGGKTLIQKQLVQKSQQLSNSNTIQVSFIKGRKRQYYQRFIHEMNKKANQLYMQKTNFVNSHGLSNPENKSCAFDLAILCQYCMNNAQFRKIVSCIQYQTQIKLQTQKTIKQGKQITKQAKRLIKKQASYRLNKQFNSQFQEMKDTDELLVDKLCEEEQILNEEEQQITYKIIKWENTHNLLRGKSDLYVGIKTGITNTAGPCLASCLNIRGRRFIIIVLNCKNINYRLRDTEALRKWLFNRQSIQYAEKLSPQKQSAI